MKKPKLLGYFCLHKIRKKSEVFACGKNTEILPGKSTNRILGREVIANYNNYQLTENDIQLFCNFYDGVCKKLNKKEQGKTYKQWQKLNHPVTGKQEINYVELASCT